jgi:AAA domain, putative AbiEii toxin, Type IV TA system
VTHFSVGSQSELNSRFFRFKDQSEKLIPTGLIVAFRENDGLPVPCHVFAWLGDVAIAFFEQEYQHIDRRKQFDFASSMKIESMPVTESNPQGLVMQRLIRMFYESKEKVKKPLKSDATKDDDIEFLIQNLYSGRYMRFAGASAMAFAPMRSRPKRTYDQLSDEFSPEGDHVPLLLARATDPNNKQSKALHEALRDFGAYSEMFTDIGVKQLGRGSGDPFQVQVKNGSKNTNLVDVGYGVSQILPLIVDAQRASSKTTLLLQQPEVHLHPKAQAALGSMIKDWVSKGKKTVVVETHSDYLVDRLRLEVKRTHLKQDEVKIFFLEKKGNQTKLHILEIDSQGNVLNAPDGYRDFFLREQMALLVD